MCIFLPLYLSTSFTSNFMKTEIQPLGFGVGLRTSHYTAILNEWPRVDWFEAITENYLDSGGRPVHILEQVRQKYPIALHGVSLSIGSVDPLDQNYLKRLKILIHRINPAIVSDHLCWSDVQGEELHDLLPLPFTEEALKHIVRRIQQVQEFLSRKILLENVSSYVTYKHSAIPEWEFLTEIAKRSGCGILLDVNNVYVNAVNHRFDPRTYLRSVPREFVGQFHLAGHTDMGEYLFDTHSARVIDPVWKLYEEAVRLFGNVPTLIEWDEEIPEFPVLMDEVNRAREVFAGTTKAPHPTLSPRGGAREIREHFPLPLGEGKGEGPSLIEIQTSMRDQIVSPSSNSSSRQVSEWLNPQGSAQGIERLSVYAAGYIARTHDGLLEAFQAVCNLVGADYFHDLVKDYVRQYPSKTYNLSLIGKNLPEFLETSPLKQTFPFLPDLARLEWLIVESFHAFDEKPVDQSEFSKVPVEEWEAAKFKFQPSVRLFESNWQIADIWKARRKLEGTKLNIQKTIQRVLIFRRDFQVQIETLEALQFSLYERLMKGETLGEACEILADEIGDQMPPIAEWFSRLCAQGILMECRVFRRSVMK